jgi:hypothetical protein
MPAPSSLPIAHSDDFLMPASSSFPVAYRPHPTLSVCATFQLLSRMTAMPLQIDILTLFRPNTKIKKMIRKSLVQILETRGPALATSSSLGPEKGPWLDSCVRQAQSKNNENNSCTSVAPLYDTLNSLAPCMTPCTWIREQEKVLSSWDARRLWICFNPPFPSATIRRSRSDQLAQMIWVHQGAVECMDDERRQILEQAAELDHIWVGTHFSSCYKCSWEIAPDNWIHLSGPISQLHL